MKGRRRRRPSRFLARLNGCEPIPQVAVRQKEVQPAHGIGSSILLQDAPGGFHGGREVGHRRFHDGRIGQYPFVAQAVRGMQRHMPEPMGRRSGIPVRDDRIVVIVNHEDRRAQISQMQVRIVVPQAVSETHFISVDKSFVNHWRNAVPVEGVRQQILESQRRRDQHGFQGRFLVRQSVDDGRGAERMGDDAADVQAPARLDQGPDGIGEFEIAGAPALGGSVGGAVEGDGGISGVDQGSDETVKLYPAAVPAVDQQHARPGSPSPPSYPFVMDAKMERFSPVKPSPLLRRKGGRPGGEKSFFDEPLRQAGCAAPEQLEYPPRRPLL